MTGPTRPATVDRRGELAAEPFAWRVAKDGTVYVTHRGRPAATLRGDAAMALRARLAAAADPLAEQLVLARITGHFKHGNERRS